MQVTVPKVLTRRFSTSRKARFSEIIAGINWLSFVEERDDLNDCASDFQECLFDIFDSCFPTRIIRFRSTDPPWIKPSLKILLDDRDRAFSFHQMQKYFRLREEVIRHTIELKEQYLKSALFSQDSGKKMEDPSSHRPVFRISELFLEC